MSGPTEHITKMVRTFRQEVGLKKYTILTI